MGLTRLERQMGNSAQDRQEIANAAVVPRGRVYRQDLADITNSAPAPAAPTTGKAK
ncbi:MULTISPECIES: hypothetical protein [unclassified Massilia]|uniref:hypothetical protein n=1 Tax=unclassified Massilia TaxID=2609279 RepID=UPI0017829F44|nr:MULTISPECIES: hypothetical protein [unclassified Massilia]MBD8531516.1 hypothetical protein [Massilia sp. CFBP 13647]MBD8673688.1 hypothetical protein [Massilia sp. CFBP 13721]